MGNAFVGLVHPCKIYNILRVAAPVLYIGPRPSHLSEMLDELNQEYPCASVAHGEVGRVVEEIQRLRRADWLGRTADVRSCARKVFPGGPLAQARGGVGGSVSGLPDYEITGLLTTGLATTSPRATAPASDLFQLFSFSAFQLFSFCFPISAFCFPNFCFSPSGPSIRSPIRLASPLAA